MDNQREAASTACQRKTRASQIGCSSGNKPWVGRPTEQTCAETTLGRARNREVPRGGEQRTEETQTKHDEVAVLDKSKIPNHSIRDPHHHGLRSPCGSTLLALTSLNRNRVVFAPKKYVPLQCKLTGSGGTFVN